MSHCSSGFNGFGVVLRGELYDVVDWFEDFDAAVPEVVFWEVWVDGEHGDLVRFVRAVLDGLRESILVAQVAEGERVPVPERMLPWESEVPSAETGYAVGIRSLARRR